jgi:SAM-dependent methyltransferase
VGRFASTVAFYERARQPYGDAFFAAVARRLLLDRSQRVLDLGTGPGILAFGLAPFCREVVGVDPEPAMIDAARRAADRSGLPVRLVEGRAEDLSRDIGEFDVVTIGRALHWMEPDSTRAALDRLVARNGFVLICRAASASDGRNSWLEAYDAVRRRWTETSGADRHRVDLDAFFAGTRFQRRAAISVENEQTIPIDRLIERALSMSSSSLDRIGAEKEAMAAALRGALAPFAQNDRVREIVEARAETFASVIDSPVACDGPLAG